MSVVEHLAQFHTPKAGSSEQEYEDASSVRVQDEAYIRVAVSDGATESFRSGRWARNLVDAFVNSSFDSWWGDDWITTAKTHFEEHNDYTYLPWHSVVKAANGSHAAFMGLEVDLIERTFRTFSVGDCCLLVQGRKTAIYPRRLSGDPRFNSTPDLLSTRSPYLPYPRKTKKRSVGSGRADFWLMTDALAEAVLNTSDFHLGAAAELLRSLATDSEFESLVDEMRTSRSMKNDDVTLVHVAIGERMG